MLPVAKCKQAGPETYNLIFANGFSAYRCNESGFRR